jgi:hypothetical protein
VEFGLQLGWFSTRDHNKKGGLFPFVVLNGGKFPSVATPGKDLILGHDMLENVKERCV